jgi:hypothetical protein
MTLKSRWEYRLGSNPDSAFEAAMKQVKAAHELGLSFNLSMERKASTTGLAQENNIYYVVKVGTRRIR